MTINHYVIWIILFILFSVIEIMTINFVTVWFAISSFILSIFSYFVVNTKIEVSLFAFISMFLIIFTRPLINKIFKTKEKFSSQNIGDEVEIVGFENSQYLVKFKGSIWNTISKNKEYKIGDKVKIKGYTGNKIEI